MYTAQSRPSLPLYRHTPAPLAGVCKGIAAFLAVPPWLVRLLFVALAFVGAGVVLYLLAWWLLPTRPGGTSRWCSARVRAIAAVVLCLLGVACVGLWLLSRVVSRLPAPPAAFALSLTLLGAVLIRPRLLALPRRWSVPAILLAILLAVGRSRARSSAVAWVFESVACRR